MIGPDFLEMPIVHSGHDFLQVHTDFLTGRVWHVPIFKTVTSSATDSNFIRAVFRYVGLPDTLVFRIVILNLRQKSGRLCMPR
jgi:hypothetical protein